MRWFLVSIGLAILATATLIFLYSEAKAETWSCSYMEKASVTDLRFHDLRHEAISRFFEMGLSVPEVALISGHRDPRMLFRHTHLRAEEVGKKLRQKM